MNDIVDFPLFYEYINDEDMERDRAFMRKCRQERRALQRFIDDMAVLWFLMFERGGKRAAALKR